MADPVVFSDFSCCEPSSALSRERRPGCWTLVDYETMDGVAGTMAFAAPEDDAPEIRLPVDLKGPHRIDVGINYTRSVHGDYLHHAEWPIYGQVQMKFDTDPGFTRFALEAGWKNSNSRKRVGRDSQVYRSMQQAYWRTADLTGVKCIAIKPMGEPYKRDGVVKVSNVSYIRFTPLNDQERKEWEALQPREDTKRGMLMWCSGMLSGHAMGNEVYHPTDPQWMRDELAPFINTDIGTIIFEAIRGSLCCYHTKLGDIGSPDGRWDPSWIDPLEVTRDVCREHGLKVVASMRMMGRGYPMIGAPIARGMFYQKHPEWAKKARNGMPCTNLSIAYPEARQLWLGLLREVLDYGIDGVHLYLHRSQPFVMFEEPVVDSFREKYGEDPREVPDDDPRFIRHRADYVTTFLREIRQLVDEKPGRTLGVTFWGCQSKYDVIEHYDPILYNCDVNEWIDEKLVDVLIPTTSVTPELLRGWKERAGDRVKIHTDVMPRTQPPEQFVRLMRRYYEAGADGYALWDGERRPPHASEWAILRTLGHRDQLDLLEKLATTYYKRTEIKVLSGFYVPDSFHDG